MIITAGCLYCLQHLIYAFATTPAQVIFAQMLLGPGYSLLLVATLDYVYKIVPDNLKATAQTIVNATGYGLSSIIGNYGGGLIITYVG